MKRKVLAGVMAIAAVILCIGVVKTLSKSTNGEKMDTTVVVETETVQIGTLDSRSTYIGTISSEGTTSVVATVSGLVEGVHVSVGDFVEEGTLLCDIEDESARLSLESAEKNYETVLAGYGGSDLSLVKEQVRIAQSNYERSRVLYESGSISRVDFEQVGQSLHSAQAGLASAQANIQAAAHGIETARYQYSLYHITAPVSGVVEAVHVTANNFFSSGKAAFVISNGENKTITFFVTDEVRRCLAVGQPVAAAYQTGDYEGVISEISGVVDGLTGLFQIKAIIDHAHNLPDGLSVELTMVTHKAEDAALIPCDALYFDNGQAYVYVVEENKAVRKDVELILYTTERAAIGNGLEAGDEVIVTWSQLLKDGVLVQSVTDVSTDNKEQAE